MSKCLVCGDENAEDFFRIKKVMEDKMTADVGTKCQKCGKEAYKETVAVPLPLKVKT